MLTEVESRVIGEMVMDRLKNIDEVSYVRFASVYREFKDITTFIDEINVLRTEKNKMDYLIWWSFSFTNLY